MNRFCCELFKVMFDNNSFDFYKDHYWGFFFDDKNREGGMVPNISPISYCPFCGQKLQALK